MPTPARVAPQALSDLSTVITFLQALPDTSEAIAAYLHERGVKGAPGAECACPLYAWLSPYVAGTLTVQRGWARVDGDGYSAQVDVPTAVIEFTLDFDSGVYPFLYRDGEV
jgi:hypothetical protein